MGNSFVPEEWAEVLRTKGIRAKGYGLIPKYAMQDRDLKIAEKGLYAYLCSLAGNEFEAYPAVSTIKSHLQIGDKAYSTYINALIETGYITRKATRKEGQRFDNNLYLLSQQPKKFFLESPLTPKGEVIRKTIRAKGVLGGGYGFITRMIMFDQRLDIKAKALYAYLAAFTGAGEVAYPSREQIMRELGISKNLYYSCQKQLMELNYITVERNKVRNFEPNRYILNACPDDSLGPQRIGTGILDTSKKGARPILASTEKEGNGKKTLDIPMVSEDIKGKDTEVSPPKQGQMQRPSLAGTVLAGTETASTVPAGTTPASPALAGTEEEGTNNITLPINPVSKNSFEKYQSYLSLPDTPLYAPFRKKFLSQIDEIDRLPREKLIPALLEWFSMREEDFDLQTDPAIINQGQAIINIVTDFLDSKQPLKIKNISISHEEFLTRFLQMDQNDLLAVGERISLYIASGTIGNPLTYTLSAVYNQAIAGQLDPNS